MVFNSVYPNNLLFSLQSHHIEQQQQQQQQQQMQSKMEQLHLRQDPSPAVAPTPAAAVPADVEWLYLDPQGNLQGPFSRVDMQEWHGSGYFAASLMLRRTCDQR